MWKTCIELMAAGFNLAWLQILPCILGSELMDRVCLSIPFFISLSLSLIYKYNAEAAIVAQLVKCLFEIPENRIQIPALLPTWLPVKAPERQHLMAQEFGFLLPKWRPKKKAEGFRSAVEHIWEDEASASMTLVNCVCLSLSFAFQINKNEWTHILNI